LGELVSGLLGGKGAVGVIDVPERHCESWVTLQERLRLSLSGMVNEK
jgi:hypothetical protein